MSTNANGNRAEYNSITLLGQYQSAAMTRRRRLGSQYSLPMETVQKFVISTILKVLVFLVPDRAGAWGT